MKIEDGSFLIVLSKPVNRIRILFQKWLAFMSIFVVFIALLSIAHACGCLAEQKGNYITKYLWKAVLIEFGISLIFLLIFSSIALMFSTFFSSKGVMGILFCDWDGNCVHTSNLTIYICGTLPNNRS